MNPPNASLLLIMICFWVSYWLINRYLLRPVGAVLEERRRRLAEAEALWEGKKEEFASATDKLEQEMSSAARQAAEKRAEQRAAAENAADERMEEARRQADARLTEALEDLDRETAEARDRLRTEAKRLGALMVSRVLGRELAS